MENIDEWIGKVNASGISIIVEGKKDVSALRKIGIKNPVFCLSVKPIYQVAEDFTSREVIILTDFDKKGKELYGKLSTEFQSQGVGVDRTFREWLQRNTKLSHIEGIDKYFTNNQASSNNSN